MNQEREKTGVNCTLCSGQFLRRDERVRRGQLWEGLLGSVRKGPVLVFAGEKGGPCG